MQIGPSCRGESIDVPLLPLEDCLAKTEQGKGGEILPGMTVLQHCEIVGVVGQAYVSLLPHQIQQRFFSGDVGLLCALHDIGKVSPSFQAKLYHACGKSCGVPYMGKDQDACIGFHYTVTAVTLYCKNKTLAMVLGRHHGFYPIIAHPATAELYGGKSWQDQREKLVHSLELYFSQSLDSIEVKDSDVDSGLVTLADWIGSDCFFTRSDVFDKKALFCKARKHLERIGLYRPDIIKNLSFLQLFGFTPREMQRSVQECITRSGVYVIEAPMGEGKTEAALQIAYDFLQTNQATGVYYALPSRIAADQMYERFEQFVETICTGGSKQRLAQLIHGQAWMENGMEGQEDIAPGGSWFSSAKRSILAPFGVGTVDQALLGVLRVRHNGLRLFGLTGKVVILDEVHSYDAYTGMLLSELVRHLQAMHCTIVMLSATLPRTQKAMILGVPAFSSQMSVRYPLLSTVTEDGYREVPLPVPASKNIFVKQASNDEEGFSLAIDSAMNGQQVLWIENTVGKAQSVRKILGARLADTNVDVGLLHSRFTPEDRAQLEQKWIACYGKRGRNERIKRGRILVGTQVLEQSLDIDADLLVTRLCPMDLLLQRSGRLWRHSEFNNVRPAGSLCEVMVLPCLWHEGHHWRFLDDSRFVYAPYILCRSYEVLKDVDSFHFPSDIPRLVDKTYEEHESEDDLQVMYEEMCEKKKRLCSLALSATTTMGSPFSDDDQVSTRYNDQPTGMLLLLKEMREQADSIVMTLQDGQTILISRSVLSLKERKLLSLSITRNSITLPLHLLPAFPSRFRNYFNSLVYLGKDGESCRFSLGLVKDTREVIGLDNNQFSAWYSRNLGLEYPMRHED